MCQLRVGLMGFGLTPHLLRYKGYKGTGGNVCVGGLVRFFAWAQQGRAPAYQISALLASHCKGAVSDPISNVR